MSSHFVLDASENQQTVGLYQTNCWLSRPDHKLDARVTSSIYLEQTKVSKERSHIYLPL